MNLPVLDARAQAAAAPQTPPKEALLAKIDARQARVAIVGLGYVGLPLAQRFAECGFPVTGFDTSAAKVAALNAGSSYIHHIPSAGIRQMRERGFAASCDPDVLRQADCIVVCVPTPLDEAGQPDLACIESAMATLRPQLRQGHFVCLESTTYPGTTQDMARRHLEGALRAGHDFFVGYSPEREDPGNTRFNTRNVPKICAGLTRDCLDVCMRLFSQVVDAVVPVSSTGAAEMAKLLENSYRAVNIALVNEFKKIADALGLDVLEVIDAAATKPYGFAPHYPGIGVGGHCIPVDPAYLVWKARQQGLTSTLIEAAMAVNDTMPDWVLGKIVQALPGAARARRILVLGVTYKKNVDDVRCSPSARLIELLLGRGFAVDYHDPYAALPHEAAGARDARRVPLEAARLKDYDAVVVAVDHDAVDYALVGREARLIVDTRGVYRDCYAAPAVIGA